MSAVSALHDDDDDSQMTDRLLVASLFAASLIVLCCGSQFCTGGVQKACNRALNAIAVTLSLASLFGTGLVVVPLMLLFLPLYYSPWHGAWYAIADSLWAHMHGIAVLFTEVAGFGGMRPLFYGDEPVAGESVLLIANHLSELDFVIMLSLAARMGALGGIRFICKASLAKLPVLGWGLRLHHTIFIRSRPQGRTDGSSAEALADASARARDVATDMANIRDTVASLTRKRSACTPPLWIGLYPEGTRLTPEQHKRALAFAAEEQRQPFKYLLQPREKGLRTVLDGGRPHVTHALDLTVAYEGLSAECEKNVRPAGIFDAITRDQPVHVLVRRLPLPREGEDVVAWLQAVWSEKERALARWENDGRYEETSLDLPFLVRPLLGAYLASAAVAALAASAAVLGMIEVYHMVAGGGSGMHAS